MNIQIREVLADIGKDAHILDNDRIQAALIIRLQISTQLFQLCVLQKRIDRQVQVTTVQMGEFDGFAQALLIRILRIGPRAKPGTADIDGVRSCIDRGSQTLKGSCRSQKLCLMSHVSSSTVLVL